MMFVIVTMLLVFRLPELRECWKIHRRIRFYFGLTVIAIAVNLAVGVGGLLYLTWKRNTLLVAGSWGMRNIHIALDTLMLYGALGVTSLGGVVAESDIGSRGGSTEAVVAVYRHDELSSHGQQEVVPSSEKDTDTMAAW